MELSRQQINRIDQFLRDQKVPHLDLRLELIDHLSTEIEDHLKRVAIKNFEEAFDKIEEKYTAPILKNIKKNKEEALSKFWNKKFKIFWKSYFTLPKIAFTVLVFIAFLSLKDFTIGTKSLLTGLNLLLGISGLFISLFILCRSLLSSRRLIVVESYAMNLITPYLGLQFVNQLESIGNYSVSESLWLAILLSLANTIFTIGLLGNFTSFRFWIKEEIEQIYPLIKSIN